MVISFTVRPPLAEHIGFPKWAMEEALPFNLAPVGLKKYARSIHHAPRFFAVDKRGELFWIWNTVFAESVSMEFIREFDYKRKR